MSYRRHHVPAFIKAVALVAALVGGIEYYTGGLENIFNFAGKSSIKQSIKQPGPDAKRFAVSYRCALEKSERNYQTFLENWLRGYGIPINDETMSEGHNIILKENNNFSPGTLIIDQDYVLSLPVLTSDGELNERFDPCVVLHPPGPVNRRYPNNEEREPKNKTHLLPGIKIV